MLTEASLAIKKIARRINDRVHGFDRFVDASVLIQVVRPDSKGAIRLESGRRVTVIREIRRGGVIDTKLDVPSIVGYSRDTKARKWMVSEAQAPIVLHSTPKLGQLVIGSEGGGKTTALAMWHALRWFENLGERREGGQTAPVLKRLGLVKFEFLKLWAPSWCRYVERTDFEGFELCDGSRIRFQHTHRQSAAAGSPIQGFNWSWCGRDEMQDQVDVHADIESRGRAARDGAYKQLGTATAKDDPDWRNLRDALIAGGRWEELRLLVADSPFVAENFLDQKRQSGITDREFRRRYLAEDLAPESRVYFNWNRKEHIRPRPLDRDVTSIILKRKTGKAAHALLVGHDPGTAKAASVLLKAYEVRGVVQWWVIGELFTMHASTEEHARKLLTDVQRWGCNLPRTPEICHVRAQPVGQSEDKPDLDLYRIFARVGFDVKAAQYKKDGTGTGHIRKDSRIEMINRLLGDMSNPRRLFIDVNDAGKPVAPKLVEGFETMERDHNGRAEHEAKDANDPSDTPAALGYALWPFEKEAAVGLRGPIT